MRTFNMHMSLNHCPTLRVSSMKNLKMNCKLCKNVFVDGNDFDLHIALNTQKFENLKMNCKMCKNVFVDGSDFDLHIALNTQQF